MCVKDCLSGTYAVRLIYQPTYTGKINIRNSDDHFWFLLLWSYGFTGQKRKHDVKEFERFDVLMYNYMRFEFDLTSCYSSVFHRVDITRLTMTKSMVDISQSIPVLNLTVVKYNQNDWKENSSKQCGANRQMYRTERVASLSNVLRRFCSERF